MFAFLHTPPRWYHYVALCLLACLVRSATFYFFVQHEERYCQSDSTDYHYGAWCIAKGYGMHYPDGQPIFWRTPGYPLYLSPFYQTCMQQKRSPQAHSIQFSDHHTAQKSAIWMQIIICSLLPLLIFQLALTLTHTFLIAWIAALASIFHLGFVLASTYLLTDGIALLFFNLFLIFWYRSFQLIHEEPQNHKPSLHPYGNIFLAALCLALYTWMRPMGQFIALLAASMFFISKGTWQESFKKSLLYISVFIVIVFPWFWRNHQLTGQWFFCPLAGLYLNVFNAPKILARTEHISLEEAHKRLSSAASYWTLQEKIRKKIIGDKKVMCNEQECMKTAWPLIAAHPWYFAYDWFIEVCKTTFDLYASQLVAFAGNCFKWDPLVEYLDEKIKQCLYQQPMSWSMRTLAWIEFLLSIWLWVGIVGGLCKFIVQPFFTRSKKLFHSYGFLWLKTGIIMGFVVMQTGGFGYARLRLPIESLMLILGITFWWWIYTQQRKNFA